MRKKSISLEMHKKIVNAILVFGIVASGNVFSEEKKLSDDKKSEVAQNAATPELPAEKSELAASAQAMEKSLRHRFIFSMVMHGFCREENYEKFTKDFDADKFRFFWYKTVDVPLKAKDARTIDSMNAESLNAFGDRKAWLLKYPLPIASGHPLYAIVVEDGKKGRYFTLNLTDDEFLNDREKLLKSSANVSEGFYEDGKFGQKNLNKVLNLDDSQSFIEFVKTLFKVSQEGKD